MCLYLICQEIYPYPLLNWSCGMVGTWALASSTEVPQIEMFNFYDIRTFLP